jgi:phenylpropionate dioxygenase-like ring-hydroxylating dioxygenase large terminal subunit
VTFNAYHSTRGLEPDDEITRVGHGTPCGEYLRRFWQPVAYTFDVADLPLKRRILGEDLVLFKTGSGDFGLVEQRCSHRGASLEYGVISECGIRCAYHGFHYAPDGTILETGAGAPLANGGKIAHGAYPLHIFCDLIFAYMGPPELIPPFPRFDLFESPHLTVVPGPGRCGEKDCNWLQEHENGMDPVHVAYLHAMMTGTQRGFSEQAGIIPIIEWAQNETGMNYITCRRIDGSDLVWIRINDRMMPNIGIVSANDEVRPENTSRRPYIMTWIVPIDDYNNRRFYLLFSDDRDPLRPIQFTEGFGQTGDRPYEERQRQPGDYEMMVSQGPITIYGYENLTSTDYGVIGMRQMIREGVRAVREGRDPVGIVRDPDTVIRTRGQSTVIRVPRAATPAEDVALLKRVGREIADADLFATLPPK